MYFLPTERVKGAFSALDTDCDGRISLADIQDAVLQVQSALRLHPCAAPAAQALHQPLRCRPSSLPTSILHHASVLPGLFEN